MQEEFKYLVDRLDKMDNKWDEKLDKILTQTIKTNGRVTALESNYTKTSEDVDILKSDSSFNKGSGKAIYIAAGAIFTISLIFIQQLFFKK